MPAAATRRRGSSSAVRAVSRARARPGSPRRRAGGRSPTGSSRAAPDRRALAELLLERQGIVTRDGVRAEGIPGGYGAGYGELKDLETIGACRRGYFVEGLGGAQFALAGGSSGSGSSAPPRRTSRSRSCSPRPIRATVRRGAAVAEARRCARGPSRRRTGRAARRRSRALRRAWRADARARSTKSAASPPSRTTWAPATRAARAPARFGQEAPPVRLGGIGCGQHERLLLALVVGAKLSQPLDPTRKRKLGAAEALDEVAAPAGSDRLEILQLAVHRAVPARDALGAHAVARHDSLPLEQQLRERAPVRAPGKSLSVSDHLPCVDVIPAAREREKRRGRRWGSRGA